MDHTATIQKLSEDVSYLRGRFDTAIPAMEKSAENIEKMLALHTSQIDVLEKEQQNMKGKATIIGVIAGSVVAGIITWIGKHF